MFVEYWIRVWFCVRYYKRMWRRNKLGNWFLKGFNVEGKYFKV